MFFFLPLMRNKLTDDVRTRLREKCHIWAGPSYSDLPRNSDDIAYITKQKRAQPGIEPGTSPSAQGSPEGVETFPKGV